VGDMMRNKLPLNLERRNLVGRMDGKVSVCCAVMLGVLVFLTGCAGERSQAIVDLVPLQAEMVAEYGASNVTVELASRTLGVTLVRSPASNLAGDWGAEQAREIAEFVCRTYDSMRLMDRVKVALEIRQTGFMAGPAVSVAFPFERGELDCGDGW
jgi:hypothetical protein